MPWEVILWESYILQMETYILQWESYILHDTIFLALTSLLKYNKALEILIKVVFHH